MAARKSETFPIQILGLSQIVVDHALQSRVSTSMEYQREFSEAMLRGDEFPPVTVFFDGKKYWLADGFHRFGARKILARSDRKFDGIKSEIRTGSMREAAIFSAGANQKFSIPRSKDDIKKALYMLFEFPEWLSELTSVITSHTGISCGTVTKHRAAFCEERGIKYQDITIEDGKRRPRSFTKKVDGLPAIWHTKRVETGTGREVFNYRASVNGKVVCLGQNRDKATSKLKEMVASDPAIARRSTSESSIENAAAARGLVFKRFMNEMASRYRGVGGLVGYGYIITGCDLASGECIARASSRVIFGEAYLGDELKKVVVAYPNEGDEYMVALAKKVGVKVLTMHELFREITQAEGEPTPEASPGEQA